MMALRDLRCDWCRGRTTRLSDVFVNAMGWQLLCAKCEAALGRPAIPMAAPAAAGQRLPDGRTS